MPFEKISTIHIPSSLSLRDIRGANCSRRHSAMGLDRPTTEHRAPSTYQGIKSDENDLLDRFLFGKLIGFFGRFRKRS